MVNLADRWIHCFDLLCHRVIQVSQPRYDSVAVKYRVFHRQGCLASFGTFRYFANGIADTPRASFGFVNFPCLGETSNFCITKVHFTHSHFRLPPSELQFAISVYRDREPTA
jgi:hypothetical protein